ncbi:hypothetical protein WMF11_46770 [Sorangium sp. So ce295]|uniref:hypothetical protein n=1 Tax=Sorangium sp. So ce295 TaxID=3133295 RepID=UPI003F5F68DA
MDEPERRDEDPDQGAGEAGSERASLGILFLAAAFALALLLTVVALLAFAAMSPRSPSAVEVGALVDALADVLAALDRRG